MQSWSDNQTSDRKDQVLMQNWVHVQSLLLSLSGKSDLSSTVVTDYSSGSVIVNANISPNPEEDPNKVLADVNKNAISLSSTNFKVLTTSSTVNGFPNPPSGE